jgi:hypothetical protein
MLSVIGYFEVAVYVGSYYRLQNYFEFLVVKEI